MYERSRTVVRCAVGQTEEFKVEVGLHQGSALSPFLFAIVMDQLSEEVRQESPWTMTFADDIVICSESREQVEENLERWRFALERRGMKVSRSKTEYMCVNEREGSGTVRLQGEEVKKVQEFKYLGSTVQSNGESGKEVKKRVQAGWNGWRKVSGVLCDRKMSARIKGKVYRTVVRPAMLYGLETVSLRKRQESELEVAELKMLRNGNNCSVAAGTRPPEGGLTQALAHQGTLPGLRTFKERSHNVKCSKLVLKQVKSCLAGTISALQQCFEHMAWHMFREAATDEAADDCKDVCAAEKSRDSTFRAGTKVALRTARAKLSHAIREAKCAHAQRIHSHFRDNGGTWRMWQGIQAITNYRKTSAAFDSDASLPDALSRVWEHKRHN
ncbi:hypothetical protein QTP70_009811 [Hemibagrus guttatus]|uniref:ribonuclease H n=1 Tax=Hemibagrus guttatus TaxID=175788 RepID=A0AAE0UPX7_9TELE|nr:hypothetical protein QTP70_009811 [Hemibagrus guttatus]KAK3534196.1 hypothetical protein QTP86_003333 [Hemibagrus guttatus]